MPLQGWKNFLRAGSALGLLVIATAQADAGGFAVREQSAYGQGSSFAGIAAGGALSSMFWNPATITQVRGISIESDIAGIIPYANQNPSAGSALAGLGGVGNSGVERSFPAATSPCSSIRICGSECPSMHHSDSPSPSPMRGPAATIPATRLFAPTTRRRASPIASMIGSASAQACRSNMPRPV